MLLKFNKLLVNKKRNSKISSKSVAEVQVNKQNFEKQLDETSNIKEGKVIIQFTGASPASGGLMVGFFISNGFSSRIECTNISLILMDSNKHTLARQSFDGNVIGKVNSMSEKACVVCFLPKNVFVNKIPSDSQLYFDLS